MNNLAFLDTEIDPKSGLILDIGCLKGDGSQFHRNSIAEFMAFLDFVNRWNICLQKKKNGFQKSNT